MLKKLYVFSLLLIAYGYSLSAQGLIANTYNNLLLMPFNVNSIASCAPDPDFSITVDASLIPYANGVEIVAVITSMNSPQPNSIYTSYGPLSIGDTLPFDTTLSYPIYFFAGGGIAFEYRAVGVPVEVGESYDCGLSAQATLGTCNNVVLLMGSSTLDCEVLPFNSIQDGADNGWELYPSPSQGPLRLAHKDGRTKWESAELFDLQGRLLNHWEDGEELSTDGLEKGIYFLKFESLGEESVMRVLVD